MSGDRFENGRFSGTVNTEECETFTLAESKREVLNRIQLSPGTERARPCHVALGEIPDTNAQILVIRLLQPLPLISHVIILLIIVVNKFIIKHTAREQYLKAADHP